ncbi:MAG: tandem-95 repeat protein, partial [Sphaerochaeta sp.]|uniref:tandem-95 repeat protein n=1 Tax=Sphaerochaeta sp. TaxID=1972642 RepID=UPI00258DE6EB
PVNTTLPSISGTFAQGNTLTALEGVWNDDTDGNTGTLSYDYQWQRAADGLSTDGADIATGAAYTLTASDSHQYVRIVVTVTDNDASGASTAQAVSAWYAVQNTAPVLTETSPAMTTDEDTEAALTLHAADADTDTLTWSVTAPAGRGTAVIDAASGAITYTPNQDENGEDSFQITVADNYGGSAKVTVAVTLNAVNDVPSFTVGSNRTVAEDCGAQSVEKWITVMSAGPANEAAQTLTYLVTVTDFISTDNAELFAVAPAVSPEGTLTFTPADNAYGSATVSIAVQDNGGGDTDTSEAQSFTITVTPVNDKPVIIGEAAVTTPEDTPYAYAFSLSDVEEGPSNLTIAYETDNTALLEKSKMILSGTGADRTLTVTPQANRSGTAHITLTITDDQGGRITKTVTLTVTPVNDAPTVYAISPRTTSEDTNTGAIGFTIADIDSALNTCTVSATSGNPTLVPDDEAHILFGGSDAARTISILPAQDQYGTADITVVVSDGELTAETTFPLTVTAVNDKPTVTAISAQTIDEDTNTGAIAFTVADVDNLATDLEVSAAANNTAMVPRANIALSDVGEDGSCTVTVTPIANYSGSSTITLTVKDPSDALCTTSFLLTVTPVNDPPAMVAVANQTTNEDVAKTISVSLSDIDTAAASLVLKAIASSNPALLPLDDAHIVISGTTNTRSVKMVPLKDQYGTTDVTLQVSDGGEVTASRTFTLTVKSVNDAPSFTPGAAVTVSEDCGAYSVPGWATNIYTGADNETEALTFNLRADIPSLFAALPAIDSVTGTLAFTPALNANGDAVITVSLTDEDGATSSSVDFDIHITPVNDAPVACDVSTGLDTDEDQQLKGSLHIEDPDHDTITCELVSGEEHGVTSLTTASGGTVTLDAESGTFTYTPFKDFFEGPEVFSYRAYDGTVYSNDATVTIALTGINDPPVAADGAMTINEDADDAAGSLANWVTDVDNATLAYSIVTPPDCGGTVTLAADTGAFTYLPAANYFGTERFTFRAYDGQTYSNTATVTVTINSVNDAPVAQNETISLDEGKVLHGMFKSTDIEKDAVTYAIVTAPESGTMTLDDVSTGEFTYTPAAMGSEPTVTVTATYKAEDTYGDSTTATVTVTLRNINDPPVIGNLDSLSLTTEEDTPISGSVAATDPDGDALVYTLLNGVNHGTLTSFDTATGNFSYTPYNNFNGTDYFTFIATEDRAENALSTGIYRVAITVTAVNDIPSAYGLLYYTREDTPITITPVGFDPDWNALTYKNITSPATGTLTGNGTTFTFTPAAGSAGSTVSFQYTAVDSAGGESESATITIHIYGLSGTSKGLNYIADQTIEENTSTGSITVGVTNLTIASCTITSSNTWLLANDSSSIAITKSGSDYSFVLTPHTYRTGRTVITVSITDTESNTYMRTFVLTVTHLFFQPTAYGLKRTIDENTEMYEYVSGSDLNGDGIYFSATSTPAHGTLDFSTNGTFHYTPTANFSGDDFFTFTASNGSKESDAAMVTIHVTDVPAAPTADNATVTTDEDTPILNGQL